MYIFKDIAKNIGKIKKTIFNNSARQIFENDNISDEYIELITKRLYNEGTDINDNELRTDRAKSQKQQYYSKFTQKNKIGKIKPVTLYDTGEFYNSIKLLTNKTFYSLKADFNKENGHIFDNFQSSYKNKTTFEYMILDLTPSDREIFFDKIFYPIFLEHFKNQFIKEISNV